MVWYEMDILKKALLDFFTGRMMVFAFAPLVVCGLLWFGVIGYGVYALFSLNAMDLENSINSSLDTVVIPSFLIVAIQWLIIGIIGVGGIFSSVYVSVALALFIISFLTPFIVSFVNNRHYHHKNVKEVSFIKVFLIMGVESLKFVGFLLASIFLFVVPFIGSFLSSICIFLSFFYIYYKFMIIDVRSCVLEEEKFLLYPIDNIHYKISVFVFYILSHIPFVGFFCQVFFIIFLTHLVYKKELGYGLYK